MFNAVQILRDLNATGTSQAQNERIVMALQDLSQAPDLGHLATKDELKSEIALVRGDMALMKGELKADIARLEGQIAGLDGKLDSKIGGLDGKLSAHLDALDGKIALLEADLKVWIVGATAIGILAQILVGLIFKAMHLA